MEEQEEWEEEYETCNSCGIDVVRGDLLPCKECDELMCSECDTDGICDDCMEGK